MFKRAAISVSVLTTLLVGCGGGGSGDAGSTGKNNINGGQSRVVYPMGIYVATLGNGSDDILRASDTSPRYMGIGIGYHYTGEQQFWSQSVSVDASNDYHKVEVSVGSQECLELALGILEIPHGGFPRPGEITYGFVFRFRHIDGIDVAVAQQLGQLHAVAFVRFDLLAGFLWNQ